MLESVKMIVVLTLFSAAASFGLAAINQRTTPLIAENERLFTLRSIKKVIPDSNDPDPCKKVEPRFDNDPGRDAVCVDGATIYRGRKNNEVIGLAVVARGDDAYSGTIKCLVGIDLDGTVTGLEVLKHAETPGLGAKIEDCAWRGQLVGKSSRDMIWKVVKDGGDVDQISGATISSRSMIDAVLKARKIALEKKEQILSAKPMAHGEACDAD